MIAIDFILLTLLWTFVTYIKSKVKVKFKGRSRRAYINRLCVVMPMYGLFAIATILTTLHHIWEIWF